MTAGSRPTQLRRDIEGLRAIAVGVVLLYHLKLPWLPGGFAGVDIFFVISGFLITSLMLREVARTGTVSLSDFYARRARRLLPPASLVIVVTLIAGWFVLPRSQRTDLLSDVLGSTLYVVNWVLSARSVDYLAEDAGASPLQHYWSLSVEEQFYVVWPLLILLALFIASRSRMPRHRVAFVLLGLLGLASAIWSVLLTRSDPATAYFVTTTRLWELAAGALLAFAVGRLAQLPRWAAEVMVLLGLVLIVVAVTVFTSATPWPGWAAGVPVLGAVLVIAAGAAGHPTLGARLLGVPPMVWIGGLSYSIYLWHWPLVVLAEARWGALSVPALVGLGVASILLAWATKHLVEDPVRFSRTLSARPWRSLTAGGVAMALICAVALALWTTRPTVTPADRGDVAGAGMLVADPEASDWELVADPASDFDATGPLVPDPPTAPKDIPSYYADDCQVDEGDPLPRDHCVYGVTDSDVEVVLWGDSKIGQYFTPFEHIALEEGWRLKTYLKSRCPPTSAGAPHDDCSEFGGHALEELLADPPDAIIIGAGTGSTEQLSEGLIATMRPLTEQGVPIVVLRDNPHPDYPEDGPWSNAYDCADVNSDDLRACDFPLTPSPSDEMMDGLAEELDLPMIDLNEWMCPADLPCPVAIGGSLIYRQGSHVTDTYARTLTPFLHRELVRAGLSTTPAEEIGLDDVPHSAEGSG
ncbi:acyltransferase family protein [Ornithinimicrobium sp. Y1847]|uniref:acyltransferase family protein n=1 Tax=Ornithinimicrobium sp. Y1847 TaxID=3405419 RepID=UPI003B67AE2F